MATTPFTFINAINEGKNMELTGDYCQFLTNRNFSLFQDTVHIANHANSMQNVNNDLHFQFYRNMVKKRRRLSGKWPKSILSDDINIVCEYFQISVEKSLEALRILTEEQLTIIRKWYKENSDGQLKI